jgi:BirA family biotin operon repressor/biotin-[acetyl-CoA-carboxylase] ligase
MELTAAAVQNALAPRAVRFFEQVDSTNDLALLWLREGAATGSVVIADEQLKGRGRLGRTWHTPPGVALAVSVILRPKPETIPQVTMLGALAIYDTLDDLGISGIGIKWPNDVQVVGRKISGVLPEALWDGDKLLGVALGLGINVRVNFSGTELEETATSIEPEAGRPVNRLNIVRTLLDRVDYWYARLGSDELFQAWQNRLTTVGQVVSVGSVHGRAERVEKDGSLLVRDDNDQLQRVLAGDVSLG